MYNDELLQLIMSPSSYMSPNDPFFTFDQDNDTSNTCGGNSAQDTAKIDHSDTPVTVSMEELYLWPHENEGDCSDQDTELHARRSEEHMFPDYEDMDVHFHMLYMPLTMQVAIRR